MPGFPCTYCDLEVHSFAYVCQCQPQVIICLNCKYIPCWKCSKNLQQIYLKRCDKCYRYLPKYKIFKNSKSYNRYCVECCYAGFWENDGQYVKVNTISQYQFKRTELAQFLLEFCSKCYKKLQQIKIHKQADQLRNNICQQCQISNKKSQHKKQQNKTIKEHSSPKSSNKKYIPKQRIEHKKNAEQKQMKKQNKSQNKQYNRQQGIQYNKLQSRQQLYRHWKKLQNQSFFPKCMGCGFSILQSNKDDAVINQQLILCYICSKRAVQYQQRIENENKRNNTKYINSNSVSSYKINGNNQRYQQQPQQFYLQNIKNRQNSEQIIQVNDKNNKKSHNTTNTDKLNNMNISKVIITKQQKSRTNNNRRICTNNISLLPQSQSNQHRNINIIYSQPLQMRQDQQKQAKNYKIQLQCIDDQQLLQCSNCLILLEANLSIWQQNNNVLLCRCCFIQSIDSMYVRQDVYTQKQRMHVNNNRVRYRQKYPKKMQQQQQKYNIIHKDQQQNQHKQIVKKDINITARIKPQKKILDISDEQRQQPQNIQRVNNAQQQQNQQIQYKQHKKQQKQQKQAMIRSNDKYQNINNDNNKQKDIANMNIHINLFDKQKANKASNIRFNLKQQKQQNKQQGNAIHTQLLNNNNEQINSAPMANNQPKSNLKAKLAQQQKYKNYQPVKLKSKYVQIVKYDRVKQCTKCKQYKVISNKYQINGQILCMQCAGIYNLQQKKKPNKPIS